MGAALDWHFLLENTGGGQTYVTWLLHAWGWTLAVSGASLAVALLAGTLVGTFRTFDNRLLNAAGSAWTELFRNIPVLVQLFVWYQVLPGLFPLLQAIPSFILVVLGLGLFTSARISEQVRSGILALPRGQQQAGMALGLSRLQTYRYVLLPAAFRIIIPPLTTESMNIVKNSSVAFAVSVPELTSYAMQVQEETARGIAVYLIVSLLYFISSFSVGKVGILIEKRMKTKGSIGARS